LAKSDAASFGLAKIVFGGWLNRIFLDCGKLVNAAKQFARLALIGTFAAVNEKDFFMENEVTVYGKKFRVSLPAAKIQARVAEVASQINADLAGKDVVFLSILNGSFMFAADLLRGIDFQCKISFVKFSSYEGQKSTGNVRELIGLNEDIKGKTVVIVEDIVDTGKTMVDLLAYLQKYEPAEVRIATLMFKPESCCKELTVDYFGFAIPNDFIIGYGLDFDGLGRNLKDIYTIVQ
jgi:hypoxanthine phosphoribosyltransferase